MWLQQRPQIGLFHFSPRRAGKIVNNLELFWHFLFGQPEFGEVGLHRLEAYRMASPQ
jgi:hypothetical protein